MASPSFPLLLSLIPFQGPPSVVPRYLEVVRVVSARPSEGSVILVEPDGEERRLSEGDSLVEEGGLRLEEVTASTLVWQGRVTGPDGEPGETLIVVRFDRSGKTKVREYRTVPDVSRNEPRPKDRR